MANTKSAKKADLQNKKRYQINLARKTAVKNVVKRVLAAISNGDQIDTVKELMRTAESQISRAKNKILQKNCAIRKVSRLAKRVSEYEKEQVAK